MAYHVDTTDAREHLTGGGDHVRCLLPGLHTPVDVLDELLGVMNGDLRETHKRLRSRCRVGDVFHKEIDMRG